jgi:GT2 family glycosyltransferase
LYFSTSIQLFVKIAVVILNWNGKKLLETFLPSIVTHSSQAEIYVADNASSDGSISFIQSNFPTVKIIQNKKNGGFAKGYNDALQKIDADIYALVNSDVEVTENWLPPIIETFQKNKNTAIIQPKILDYKNKNRFEYAGAAGGFLDALGYPYCRGRIFNSLETDKQQYNDTIDINWASGACFFIRTAVYHELKGFDEDYFAHQEEIDLCWRTRNISHDIQYVGKSKVYHLGGGTLNEANSLKTFLNFRNSLFTLVKNLPTRKIGVIVLMRMVLDGVAGLYFILQGRPIHTFAILRAHISFYLHLRKMIAKRLATPKISNYNKSKSIVWSYFVLNIKKSDKII